MTYEECVSIIEQFRQQHPFVLMSSNVHGLIVNVVDGQPVLQLRVKSKVDKSQISKEEVMVSSFDYRFQDTDKSIRAEVIETDIPQALKTETQAEESSRGFVPAGSSAKGIDLQGWGTAGWSIILKGVPVCVSNWHVLCGLGNDTPLGRRIILNNYNVASLYTYQPVYAGAKNLWDYALARYDNGSDALAEMVPCENGNVYIYPQNLSKNVAIGDGQPYHKVGIRSPICRTGTLNAVGDVDVEYSNGQIISFSSQLLFSKMADRGDSGAVIVRDSDNTVTGLNFAGSSTYTMANPLFKNDWHYRGSIKFENGKDIPMFDDFSSSLVTTPDLAHFDLDRPTGSNLSVRELPNLDAGRLFLREAVLGRKHVQLQEVVWWIVPIPAPIRPNVPVESYEYKTLGKGDHTETFYLCFG
jgi:hypothetical protein